MSEISLERLKKALGTLKNGYKDTPSELERDGLIQRFEYSLELCWKSARKVLIAHGIQVDSPKNVFREMGQIGWIENPESWIEYIDKRNETSHIYHEEVANKIFSVVKKFIADADYLIRILEEKINV